MRAAFLLSPSSITQGRMGASKAALILMENSHFDRTLQYLILYYVVRHLKNHSCSQVLKSTMLVKNFLPKSADSKDVIPGAL